MKKRYYARKRRSRRKAKTRFYVIIGVLVVALAVGIYFIVKAVTGQPGTGDAPSESVAFNTPDPDAIDIDIIEQTTEPTQEPTPTPVPSLSLDIVPHAIAGETDAATFGFDVDIMVDGVEVDTYLREQPISFGSGHEYTELEGVITFRGNNYRDAASWGTADITEETLTLVETKTTGSLNGKGGAWWTGQPLIVKWPSELRENMTMIYDEFRTKEDFVEVIYPSMSGYIYFMELETGIKTRDAIEFGAPIKGTASLDPRGYPIIYVGQGVPPSGDTSGQTSNDTYFKAFSLIDGKKLMEFGAVSRDPFAYRENWQAYDSSALVDADSDTLIVLGENGVMYTCDLNTTYDPATGAVSMDAEPAKVKYRYTSTRNDATKRWGMEDSPVAWRNYVIFTDNAGMLQCVDINTMELVYANDLTDDSDVSMVLEEDVVNNTFYLYTGCEYDELVRPNGSSDTAYARKLDGLTGHIIWEAPFTVVANDKVDGGVLASPVLGREGTSMAGLIIYNVTAEVKGDSTTSRLVALDKETGALVWDYDMGVSGWSPSSPVPVYTEDGQGYIVQCDRAGDVALIRVDGQTAEEVAKISMEDNSFEATPAVYGNMIVVASKQHNVYFIEIN